MSDQTTFLRALIGDRHQTGAVAPSGRALTHAMVASIGAIDPGSVIVELGPGTGVFTKQILAKYPNNPLLSIEANGELASMVKRRYPRAHVVCGCASRISQHHQDSPYADRPIAAVLSGLPLLSLPKPLPRTILAEVAQVLQPGAPYIQFTYSKLAWRRFQPADLQLQRSRLVLANVPPASVLHFTRQELVGSV